MSEEDTPRRGPGRPRRPGVTARVREVARDLLLEAGWQGFTIAEVARRSGVGKPTIYRRWPSRTALIYDAVFATDTGATPVPDTGSLRDDLATSLTTFIRWFSTPGGREAGRAVLAAQLTTSDPEERAMWRERSEKDRKVIAAAIERGRERGEPVPPAPPEVIADLFIDWIVHECVVKDEPPSADRIAEVVETVLDTARR